MDIRLLALDIDGTLTGNGSNCISPRSLAAMAAAKEAGVFVTIATGRSSYATKPIWDAMDLHGPSIQFGGAWTVDVPDGELLEQLPMDAQLVQDVMRFAKTCNACAQIYLESGDTLLVQHENPYTENYVKRNGMHVIVDKDVCHKLYYNVPKVVVFSNAKGEPEMRRRFEEAFAGKAHIARSQSTFIEINHSQATKGWALERLANRLGIARSQVAAMGDSYLDMDMIQWAGVGVAMEDSVEEVLNVADVVAPSADKDGVAWFIEHHIL